MILFTTGANTGQSLPDAVSWLRDLLLGSIGTTIAILAVAGIGVLMLSGRVPLRRGISVVIGCFILFSATAIVNGLLAGRSSTMEPVLAAAPPPQPQPSAPEPFDPYAGASVHMRSERGILQ